MCCWHNPHKLHWEPSWDFWNLNSITDGLPRWQTYMCLPWKLQDSPIYYSSVLRESMTSCQTASLKFTYKYYSYGPTAIAFQQHIGSHVIILFFKLILYWHTCSYLLLCPASMDPKSQHLLKNLYLLSVFLWILSKWCKDGALVKHVWKPYAKALVLLTNRYCNLDIWIPRYKAWCQT